MGKSKKQKSLDLERIRKMYPRANHIKAMKSIEKRAKECGIDLYSYSEKVIYGNNLRSARKEKKFTLQQIADILHVSPTAVFKIEKPTEEKRPTKIDLVYLEIFSLIYGVSPFRLLYNRPLVEGLAFPTGPAQTMGQIILTYLLYESKNWEVDSHLLEVFFKINQLKDNNRSMYNRLIVCLKQTPLLGKIMKLNKIIEEVRTCNDNQKSWEELMNNSKQIFEKAKSDSNYRQNIEFFQRRISEIKSRIKELPVLHQLVVQAAEGIPYDTTMMWALCDFGGDEKWMIELFGHVAVAENEIKCLFCSFIEAGGFLDQIYRF